MRAFKKLAKVSPGFSVAEVMVAVAIISIFAAVAIPNILAYLPKSRLSGATRIIVSELAAARMAAVKQNCKASVTFSNNHAYVIWVDSDNNNAQDAGEVQTHDLHPEYHDVEYDAAISSVAKIGFTSRGTGSPVGTFVLKNGSGSKRVVVNFAGRIRIG